MVTINSIKRGIVIDHITAGQGIRIFEYLKLGETDYTVALIRNANSNKLGKKDIIKIENVLDMDYRVLGFLDANATVNVIENENIIEKIKLNLPEQLHGVIKCRNPRCITAQEEGIKHSFTLVDSEAKEYRCEYCDEIVKL